MVRFVPGDVVDQIAAASLATEEDKEMLSEQFGLSSSIPEQYFTWIKGVLVGDFGKELVSGRSIGQELTTRLPRSVELGLLALVIGVSFAIPVGVIAAIRQDSPLDLTSRSFAVVLLATPSFWIATLAVVLPAKYLGWAPPPIYEELWHEPLRNLELVIVPALLIGLSSTGGLMRITRTQLLEVLRQDYIRTAWSKGLRERTIVIRHALRNGLLPVVTVVGLQIPGLVAGSVIMEVIFNIPGIGTYFLGAISLRDYPVVQAVNLLVATTIVMSNLSVDIIYSYLDPRVRLAR
jgi:peptide/nickel transport system permease protein